MSYLEKWLFKSLAHFLIRLLVFLLLSCRTLPQVFKSRRPRGRSICRSGKVRIERPTQEVSVMHHVILAFSLEREELFFHLTVFPSQDCLRVGRR